MTADARQLLDALRQGKRPDIATLEAFTKGLATGEVSDAQAGAFAMAVCLHGLGDEGRVVLTRAMRDSGSVLSWDLPGPVVDKHSTGGVGDAVSLVLAPLLAACGVYVPMISGRGLGHTGGTLDKLEAIPGVSTSVDEFALKHIVRSCGAAIVGATADLAPADKRLYAVRDVTGTIASNDLITASILSKKLAEGLEALVLDVKIGSGAFMKTEAEARALANALVETAKGAGCPTTALITDMSQPLLPALGNALEVAEVLAILRGDAAGTLVEVAIALGAEVLQSAGAVASETEANVALTHALRSGQAAERFAWMIAAQGGPMDLIDRPEQLPVAPVVYAVTAQTDGYVTTINGEALGHAVVALGGGRRVETDVVDPAVGLSDVLPLGAAVAKGAPIALVHAADQDAAEAAANAASAAITVGASRPVLPDLVRQRIT